MPTGKGYKPSTPKNVRTGMTMCAAGKTRSSASKTTSKPRKKNSSSFKRKGY